MNLLGRVAASLTQAGIPFAAVGGVALAARGVVRSTLDIDLLATDLRCLDRGIWAPLGPSGATADIRRGDDRALSFLRAPAASPPRSSSS